MMGKYGVDDEHFWNQEVVKIQKNLEAIPSETCPKRPVPFDHSWNAELRKVLDGGMKDLRRGLSLSEFPSRRRNGLEEERVS
jgi:hypothetical protein